jgi:hypothetical protein
MRALQPVSQIETVTKIFTGLLFHSGQVEQQHLGLITLLDDDVGFAVDLERVARAKRLVIYRYGTACNVHVGFASLGKPVRQHLFAVHECGIQLRILMNRDGAVAAIR